MMIWVVIWVMVAIAIVAICHACIHMRSVVNTYLGFSIGACTLDLLFSTAAWPFKKTV